MTNEEKFEEVFGEKPIISNKPYSCNGYLGSNLCYGCKYSEQTRTSYSVTTRCHILDWWNEEYKTSKPNPAKDIVSPKLPVKNAYKGE